MKAVIIAAGMGGRLSNITNGMPKTLLEVNGKPIIQWIVDDLRLAGIETVIVVTGCESDRLQSYFENSPLDNLELIHNPQWRKGNGISVLIVEDFIGNDEVFILAMSDHLIDKNIFEHIVKEEKRYPLLAVERNLGNVFDVPDATKVWVEDKKIQSIGKQLPRYNGIDIGLFLLNGSFFQFLRKSIKEGRDTLTGGVQELMRNQDFHAYDIPDESFWIDIDSEETYNVAIQMWRSL
ncbi:MAG: hypothetical protein E3J78_05725 [Candidatus Cloacimonadota bacterium]|nr:MAG: hypothetical protein E3J78_05725 [Candidatus Cloacimonadota bacterium]